MRDAASITTQWFILACGCCWNCVKFLCLLKSAAWKTLSYPVSNSSFFIDFWQTALVFIGHRGEKKKIFVSLDLVKVAYILVSLFFTHLVAHRNCPSAEVAIEWQKKFLLNPFWSHSDLQSPTPNPLISSTISNPPPLLLTPATLTELEETKLKETKLTSRCIHVIYLQGCRYNKALNSKLNVRMRFLLPASRARQCMGKQDLHYHPEDTKSRAKAASQPCLQIAGSVFNPVPFFLFPFYFCHPPFFLGGGGCEQMIALWKKRTKGRSKKQVARSLCIPAGTRV